MDNNTEKILTEAVRAGIKVIEYPTSNIKPVAALQKQFYMSTATGELRVLDKSELDDERLAANSYKVNDAKMLMKRHLETLGLDIPDKKINFVIDDFFRSPNTKLIKRFDFDPRPQGDDTLNYWKPPLIKGKPGSWDVIKDWLLRVLCNNDSVAYSYLINWLAHTIQYPETKPEVILILMGPEGTGKGTLLRILMMIFGDVVFSADKAEQLVGRFNGVLNDKFIVWSDEAIFVGNEKHRDSLKSVISEPYISTEIKHQTIKQVKSFHRFIAATNREHFANIEVSDRRNVFLRVSTEHEKDTVYFGKFWKAIHDTDELEAFVHHLRTKDLSEFDPRTKPITEELINQKLLSLKGFGRYLKEVLDEENFVLTSSAYVSVEGVPYVDEPLITTAKLKEYFTLYDKKAENWGALQQKQIKGVIKKIFPSAKVDDSQRLDNKRAIRFPSLDVARQEFQRYLGHDIKEWNLPTTTNGDKS